MTPDDPRHGTVAGYIAHRISGVPRCDACRTAARLYEQTRQTRRYLARGSLTVDGTGTRRRVRALVAIGWTMQEIDTALGMKRGYSSKLSNETGPVLRNTAVAVEAMYSTRSMTPKVGWLAERQRRIAASKGWAPPLAYDDIDDPNEQPTGFQRDPRNSDEVDPVVVQRFFEGEWEIRTTRAEKIAITTEWTARGRTLSELERATGWNADRYVIRQDGAA